jgi:hypothetical protein
MTSEDAAPSTDHAPDCVPFWNSEVLSVVFVALASPIAPPRIDAAAPMMRKIEMIGWSVRLALRRERA